MIDKMIRDEGVHIGLLNGTDEICISKLKTGVRNASLGSKKTEKLKQIHSVLKYCILTSSLDRNEVSQVLFKNGT